ncbi:MAG TPA: hypothetical protein VFP60_06015 [Pseudolabrys sp.]|nr:hypothetical protein [Pseudolabrys sp.]
MWEAAGLQDIESRRIEIEVDYKDFDDFWESSTALGSPSARQLKSLPKADLDRVHDWLRTSLAPDPNGRIRYPAYANAVKGRLAQ